MQRSSVSGYKRSGLCEIVVTFMFAIAATIESASFVARELTELKLEHLVADD
jgi:hypothetical protein